MPEHGGFLDIELPQFLLQIYCPCTQIQDWCLRPVKILNDVFATNSSRSGHCGVIPGPLEHHEIFLGGHAEASCPCISCLVVLYHRLQQRHVKLYNLYKLARVSQADRDTIES